MIKAIRESLDNWLDDQDWLDDQIEKFCDDQGIDYCSIAHVKKASGSIVGLIYLFLNWINIMLLELSKH